MYCVLLIPKKISSKERVYFMITKQLLYCFCKQLYLYKPVYQINKNYVRKYFFTLKNIALEVLVKSSIMRTFATIIFYLQFLHLLT